MGPSLPPGQSFSYRKDPENIDGWYKVGNYSDKIYKNQKDAYKDACKYIMWLKYRK